MAALAYRDDKVLARNLPSYPFFCLTPVDPFLPAALKPWTSAGPHHLEPSSRAHHSRADGSEAITWDDNISGFLDQAAGRSRTPSGTTPSRARRQSAISSLRARATTNVLRVDGAFAVRCRYHWASALSFWNMRNRHASWIMPRRTRALPERANPLSRRLAPLSSGEPVRPS